MRVRRVMMGLGGVFMGLHSMLVGGLVVAIGMVLGCCVMRLCCVLVVLRSLFVCVVCHRSPCFEASFGTPANLRPLRMSQRLYWVKISRAVCPRRSYRQTCDDRLNTLI